MATLEEIQDTLDYEGSELPKYNIVTTLTRAKATILKLQKRVSELETQLANTLSDMRTCEAMRQATWRRVRDDLNSLCTDDTANLYRRARDEADKAQAENGTLIITNTAALQASAGWPRQLAHCTE